jgi:SAM-dependent methyltransferase
MVISMAYVDFIQKIHKKTERDYLGERVIGVDKAKCAEISKQFGYDYWDGDRKYGYGGYTYDGRWRPVAEDLSRHYGLSSDSSVLDLGCGKGFLLFELMQIHPGIRVKGIDISQYAVENAKEEVKPYLTVGNVTELPFEPGEFDLALSINVLHNLYIFDLFKAVCEMERVAANKYLVVDSYRNESERVNLMYWQLTCECFYTPEEWQWIFDRCEYQGDFSCIYYS